MTTHIRPSRPSRFSAFKAIILCLLAGLSTAFAEDWDGSTSKPLSKEIDGVEYYVITSPSELAWFAYQVNNKNANKINAVLGNDIHFMDNESATSKVPWTAIGLTDSTVYDGVFDGEGHTIYGLYSKGAIFGYTGENFVLKNFSVKKSSLVTWVAFNEGTIEDCTEENDGAKQIAGFAYTNNGTIRNCTSKNFGIAKINKGLIKNCQSTGFCGLYTSTFSSSTKTFDNISSGSSIAGIVCTNDGIIDSCRVQVNRESADSINSFGGIALVSNTNSIISNSSFKGNINITEPSSSNFGINLHVGGIAANFYGKEISGCNVEIDSIAIKFAAYLYLGGIVGNESYGDSASIIRESFAKIRMTRLRYYSSGSSYKSYIGGIVGKTYKGNVKNCHAEVEIDSSFTPLIVTYVSGLVGHVYSNSILTHSYGFVISASNSTKVRYSGVASYLEKNSSVENSYFDRSIAKPNTMNAIYSQEASSVSVNVTGKTTEVMQSPAFVETLNTNAGLDDDSGIWQYCEGNYPILVSEGTCEEFYSKYGISSSSQSSSSSAESSSSTPVESSSSDVESSSSQAPASSSSSDIILSSSEESSSSSVIASSSSEESSSSKAETSSSAKSESSSSSKVNSSSSSDVILSSSEESSSSSVIASSSSDESSSSKVETSSSAKSESSSSSKVNSSSSKGTDIVWNSVQPTFNLSVNGMTLTLSNTQGGVVRIFDALGHLVAAKPLASATTSITMQTPGNYIVRVNGMSEAVNLK